MILYSIVIQKQGSVAMPNNKKPKFYQIPIDSIPINIAIYQKVDDDFIFVDFNKAAQKIENSNKKDLIGKQITEVFPDVKKLGLFKVFHRVHESGKQENFEIMLYEDEHISSWRKNDIIKLPNGNIMAIYEDITKEKQLEEKIHQVNDFIDNSQTIVFFWKAQKNWPIEYVSNNISIFGYTKEALQNGNVKYADIIHPDDYERICREIEEHTKNHNEQFTQTYRILTADRAVRWVEDRTNIKRDTKGKPTHYLGSIVDITKAKNIELKLKQSEEKFRTISENSLIGIFIYTDHIIYVNQALVDMSGFSAQELCKMQIWDLVVEPMQEKVKQMVMRRLKGEKFPHQYSDLQFVGKHNVIKDVRVTTETIKYNGGYAGLGTLTDVTDLKETKAQLKLLAQAMEQTDELVRITDKDGVITYVNDAFVAHSGYKHIELLGHQSNILKSGQHDNTFYKNLWEAILAGKSYSNVLANKKKDKQIYYEELTITPMFDSNHIIQNFVATGKDITQRIKMEKRLEQCATTDELTKISNRYKGNELLDMEIDRVHRYESSFAVLMLDIDYFKKINDTYGHDKGDEVLQQLSKVISLHIRKSDAFIRWGGEEFLILTVHMNKSQAINFAKKLKIAVSSYTFDVEMNITVSIGVSLCKAKETKKSLLKRVDKALYKAKDAGRNKVVFL